MKMKMEELLEPISEANPCGDDLSFSDEFDRIQEARREDDASVDYGDWQTPLKQADWPAVIADCRQLLVTRSKDLRLAVWLAEGLVKTSGMAGLADGLEIAAHLMARFGAVMHPQVEDGDQERRIGALNWFATRTAHLVGQIPLTQSTDARYSLNAYEAAQQLQFQLQRNGEGGPEVDGKLTLDKFFAAAGNTPKTLYGEWLCEAERSQAALARLVEECNRQFGVDGPSFVKLGERIDAVGERLRLIAKDVGIPAAGKEPWASEVRSEGVAQATANPGHAAHVIFRTRADALDILRQVANFFRETEPHSPVAYLADKAAIWGRMPLHVWLRSVVKDHATLSQLEETLGLAVEQGKTGDD